MKDYTGQVVVITGAGSGMGRAYAREAARRGAKLALNDVDGAGLAETAGLLAPGTEVLTAVFDVSDRDAVYGFADAVAEGFGGADVVINNAGIESEGQPVWATSDTAFERVMAINFWGVVHGTRAFLPLLLASPAGALVNVSSLFGLVGAPSCADYSAAKFAVRGFTEALGTELLDSSVTVYTVHPGGIATNINRLAETQAFSDRYVKTRAEDVAVVVLDAIGTRRTRIVYGHRAMTTWLGARFLPQWVMSRLTWNDLKAILDRTHYPAAAYAAQTRSSDAARTPVA